MKRAGRTVAVTMLGVGLLTGAAQAAEPAGGAAQVDLMATQVRLIAAADSIRDAGGQGFAGMRVSAGSGALTLYWKGQLPAAVAGAVERARRSAEVSVLPAPYSEQELLAATVRLAKAPGVASAGPLPDGSGVAVAYAGEVAAALALPEIRDAGVRVVVERGEYAVLASRQVDSSPYSGGAKFTYQIDNYSYRCSTGWAVSQNGVFPIRYDRRLMLTAGHCGSDGLTIRDGAGAVMGLVQGDDDVADTMLIKTPSAGQMYTGAWSSSTSKPVFRSIGNYVDTLVCTSGSMSGQHCWVRVKAVNQAVNITEPDGTIRTIFPMVRAETDDHSIAVALGDSGGPVAAQDSTAGGGIYLVYAAGTISAASQMVACPSTAQPTTCFWRVYYAPLQESLERYDVSLISG